MDRAIMTVRGAELLRKELKNLKSVDRPEIIKAIATAREFGDLKENAEYHAAKEKQSFIEGRIQEIESKLSNSEIIDVTKLSVTNKVIFGSTVTLINLDSDQTVKYKIVGEDESDVDITKTYNLLQKKLVETKKDIYGNLSAWQRVQLSRHPNRPYTLDYIKYICGDSFLEMHGDRNYGDDKFNGSTALDVEITKAINHYKRTYNCIQNK